MPGNRIDVLGNVHITPNVRDAPIVEWRQMQRCTTRGGSRENSGLFVSTVSMECRAVCARLGTPAQRGFVVGYRTRWWTCSRKAGSDVLAVNNSVFSSHRLLLLIFIVSRSAATSKNELSALRDMVSYTAAATVQHPLLPSLVEAGLWAGAVAVRARLGADHVAAWL